MDGTAKNGKVSLGNKLAFACGDIFGGGSFNIINFLFVPFLTLVVGIPMIWVSPVLLFTKLWDGIIDPFIGKVTDGKMPGRFGKRRYFMLVSAPLVLVGMVLLFFPWNIVTDSVPLKIIFVVVVYILYATAQSFVLIPYYSHASEMTDDFTERNRTNAVRIAFSLASSIICVAVPGMIASPTKGDNGISYIIMASVFGTVFALSILITALFSREQIVTPAIKHKVSVKQFFRPLKLKPYRQYLGMQMCTSMGMAVMSSFFFTYCDFFIRRNTYYAVMTSGVNRFPIATVAAACMFAAQIFALPFYLGLIKRKSKRFTYIFGACLWIVLSLGMLFLPGEGATKIIGNTVTTVSGTPDWLIILFGLFIGFGIGGAMFVPHSSFGDVCDAGQLYFGERTEGAFSGLTNFLNTAAQAIGLAIPPVIIGAAGYVETQYVTAEKYAQYLNGTANAEAELGMALENFKAAEGNGSWQLVPMIQDSSAQTAIKLTLILLPAAIMVIGIVIASRYKITEKLQKRIVEANLMDKESDDYSRTREEILNDM